MKLKTRELLAFAMLSVPLSMGGLPLAIYLTPYYTAELGLSLASVGVVLLITRVSDVVTDPLNGLPVMGFTTMAADVIDQDTLDSGQQRGALFMSLWGMADKLALATAAGLTLPLLQWLGFNPAIENDLAGLKALQYTYALIPLFFLVFASIVIWKFPITQERQELVRVKLAAEDIRIQ